MNVNSKYLAICSVLDIMLFYPEQSGLSAILIMFATADFL